MKSPICRSTSEPGKSVELDPGLPAPDEAVPGEAAQNEAVEVPSTPPEELVIPAVVSQFWVAVSAVSAVESVPSSRPPPCKNALRPPVVVARLAHTLEFFWLLGQFEHVTLHPHFGRHTPGLSAVQLGA